MNKNYLLVISFVFIVLFFQGQPGPGPVGPTLPGGGAAPPCLATTLYPCRRRNKYLHIYKHTIRI